MYRALGLGDSLSRKPGDCGVVHTHRPDDRPAAIAAPEALEGLGLLVGW